MIHLFGNTYLRPLELGILPRDHKYHIMAQYEGIDKVLLISDDKMAPIEATTVQECIDYSVTNDERVVIYTDPTTFKNILTGFILNLFPDATDTFIESLFKFHANSISMRWHMFFPFNPLGGAPYSREAFLERHFDAIGTKTSLGIDNSLCGVEWLLFNEIMGEKKYNVQCKAKVQYLYKASLAVELNDAKSELESMNRLSVRAEITLNDTGFINNSSPLMVDPELKKSGSTYDYLADEYGVVALAKEVANIGTAKADILKDIAIKEKIATSTQILANVLGTNSFNILDYHIEQGYINPYIILLAKNLKSKNEIVTVA